MSAEATTARKERPMQRDPSTEVPTFIPDDLLSEYGEEARIRVAANHLDRTELAHVRADDTTVLAPARRTSRTSAPAPRRSRLTVVFVLTSALGLLGWTGLVAWWAWMAWDAHSLVWGTIAAVGALVVPAGIAAVVHMARLPEFRTPIDEQIHRSEG